MTIGYCTVLLPFVLSPLLFGQTAVREDAAHRQWYIDAGRQTYVIGVNEQEMLQSLYWGPKLAANVQLPAAKMHDALRVHLYYHAYPEGVIARQLLLNLARPDVKEWIFNWLDKLVSENDIAFLKWDYNRNWSEPGWNTAPGSGVDRPNTDAEKEIYVRYVQNLYDVLARLRKKHPKLEIESCSGGGGRVDLGILQLTDEVWPSDNTDALDRLSIQNGYTHAYSPQTMAAWVTDVPNLDGRATPLQYRFLVAMQGALGIGNNLNKWTNEDFALGAKLTALYKTVRTTVQQGRLYRLTQPLEGDQNNEEGTWRATIRRPCCWPTCTPCATRWTILRCGYAAWIRLQCIASTRSMRRSTPASKPSPAPY